MMFVVGIDEFYPAQRLGHVAKSQKSLSYRQPVAQARILDENGSAGGQIADTPIAEPATFA